MSDRKVVGVENVDLSSRPFQALFNDADYFLQEAQLYQEKVTQSKSLGKDFADQTSLRISRSNARACVVALVAGLEAFANSVLKEFGKRSVDEVNPEWLTRNQKKIDLDRWTLKDKVRFIPTLCNSKADNPVLFFKTDSVEFKLFAELVEIRNSIAHGRIVSIKMKVTMYSDKKHEADTAFPENVWPNSDFPKEIYAINYDCAKKAYTCVMFVVKSLILFLNNQINNVYLTEQEFKTSRGAGRFSREHSDNESKWVKFLTTDTTLQ
jgi:hypothetical protein